MALINCKECGKELSDTAEFCPHCGYKYNHESENQVELTQQQQPEQTNIDEQPVQMVAPQQIVSQPVQSGQPNFQQQFNPNNFFKNKPATASIVFVVIAVIVGIIIAVSIFSSVQESKKAIKVDLTMTEWYGYVDDILDELGLDFYLVTGGANCYTGVKKSEFSTEKYGILHTEFTYCKSNKRQVFRVYNTEKDQPLRDPKPGELPTFDKYGEKISSGTYS